MSMGRRRVASRSVDTPFKLSWCIPSFGLTRAHCERRDENGDRVANTCPGSVKQIATDKTAKAGTPIYCGCACHLEFQEDPSAGRPEPWPGYYEKHQDAPGDPDEDETGNPTDDVSEAPGGAPVNATEAPETAGEPS